VHPILGTVQEPVESIGFNINPETNTAAVMVGICYRGQISMKMRPSSDNRKKVHVHWQWFTCKPLVFDG